MSCVVLAAFACVAFSETSFAGGPFGIIHVGKWQGAAYTTDKGAFSHCNAAAKFDNGRHGRCPGRLFPLNVMRRA
jgi:hypothetical protein